MHWSDFSYRFRLVVCAVAIFLATPMPGFALDFYDGLRAWDGGRREEALGIWLEATDSGDAKASVRIGDAFAAGDGMPKDPVEAAYYYALAGLVGDAAGAAKAAEIVARLHDSDRAEIDDRLGAWIEARRKPKFKTVDDLIAAVRSGNRDAARAFIAGGVSPDTLDEKGWSPLMHAAIAGNVDMIAALVDAGATVNGTGFESYTTLHVAALAGSLAAVEALIARGSHAAAASSEGVTASAIATAQGHTDLAAVLAEAEKKNISAIQRKLNELGYEVGKPDGELGSLTRAQLTIFGNGQGLGIVKAPSAPLLQTLFAATEISPWTVVVTYRLNNRTLTEYYPSKRIKAREALEKRAIELCRHQRGEDADCNVLFVIPAGGCVGFFHVGGSAGGEVYEMHWLRAFASRQEAEADAKSECKKARSCQLAGAICAGE